jgi:hypothetical protein
MNFGSGKPTKEIIAMIKQLALRGTSNLSEKDKLKLFELIFLMEISIIHLITFN